MTTNELATNELGRIIERNHRYIPGGISSANRIIEPQIAFVRGQGAYVWDNEGNKYIDYHAGFAPSFLGHNFAPVNAAAMQVLDSGESLFGAGLSVLEGQLAELICNTIPAVEKVVFLNTGSEATSLAIRLSRAVTGRPHFIVMQGGYNGNHDELACNVVNTIDDIGPRVCPGEYPLRPLGAGTTVDQFRLAHAINFNDLDSVEYVCRRYPVAALILEPVLQNIGLVPPAPGYLAGLRQLADTYGFLLIFDEVKTGFRHGLGGYSEISGVTPDLAVYGKAIANGFPLACLGGKEEYMSYLSHPDPRKRPFLAGTYNGHPVSVAAAIATIMYLAENRSVYEHVDTLGRRLETGITKLFAEHGVTACVVRQGSAFSFYFMPQPPKDFHDILIGHDAERDVLLRRDLIRRGIFLMPIATKQCSISSQHSTEDIETTLDGFDQALRNLRR